MKSIAIFHLAIFLYAPGQEEGGRGGGVGKQISQSFPNTITEEDLHSLTIVTTNDFAAGMTYYVPRKVATNEQGQALYVLDPRYVNPDDLVAEAMVFTAHANGASAVLEGGVDGEQLLSADAGESTDHTSITQPVYVNKQGNQNDGEGGELDDRKYNNIQKEQVAHTILNPTKNESSATKADTASEAQGSQGDAKALDQKLAEAQGGEKRDGSDLPPDSQQTQAHAPQKAASSENVTTDQQETGSERRNAEETPKNTTPDKGDKAVGEEKKAPNSRNAGRR